MPFAADFSYGVALLFGQTVCCCCCCSSVIDACLLGCACVSVCVCVGVCISWLFMPHTQSLLYFVNSTACTFVCVCVCVFVRLTNGLFFPAAIFTLCSALTSGHLYLDMYAYTPTHTHTQTVACAESDAHFGLSFLPSCQHTHSYCSINSLCLSLTLSVSVCQLNEIHCLLFS